MSLSPETIHEIEVLSLFSADSMREGIKVHHTAEPAHIAAAERLFKKGLMTQKDGGYLTSLGMDAVTHTQGLLTIIAKA
jgi:uncharacterized protein (TIGR02647 family)